MTQVVDTNVILVANRQHPDVSRDCVAACALALQQIMAKGRIALDADFEILREYLNKTQPKTANRAGDAFVKWVLQNRANTQRCDQVAISPHPQRGYHSFPDDRRLKSFDPPDRKFVAVAAAHPKQPPVLQAADSKWLGWAPALRDHGVEVEFLCPRDIERFRASKAGE